MSKDENGNRQIRQRATKPTIRFVGLAKVSLNIRPVCQGGYSKRTDQTARIAGWSKSSLVAQGLL